METCRMISWFAEQQSQHIFIGIASKNKQSKINKKPASTTLISIFITKHHQYTCSCQQDKICVIILKTLNVLVVSVVDIIIYGE